MSQGMMSSAGTAAAPLDDVFVGMLKVRRVAVVWLAVALLVAGAAAVLARTPLGVFAVVRHPNAATLLLLAVFLIAMTCFLVIGLSPTPVSNTQPRDFLTAASPVAGMLVVMLLLWVFARAPARDLADQVWNLTTAQQTLAKWNPTSPESVRLLHLLQQAAASPSALMTARPEIEREAKRLDGAYLGTDAVQRAQMYAVALGNAAEGAVWQTGVLTTQQDVALKALAQHNTIHATTTGAQP